MNRQQNRLQYLLLFDAALLVYCLWLYLRGSHTPAASLLGATMGLAIWQAVLIPRQRRDPASFQVEWTVRRQHYLQLFVQACHFCYWACYWGEVRAWAWLIIAQLLFAYPLDALLAWSRGHRWQFGFGPFPIVLSINLFLWFRQEYFYLQLLLITTAYLGKEFVTRVRADRKTHIFNPSAFALALAAIVLMSTGNVGLTNGVDLIGSFYLPSNFYEFMFLLGLLLQLFFSTTLVTMGAVLAQSAVFFGFKYIVGAPITAGPVDIAVFLGMNLLVTDPSTSPTSKAGKLLFGLTYGAAVFATYVVLRNLNQPSYFDKILMVPVVNLFAVRFDILADRLRSRWAGKERWSIRVISHRCCHMAIYVALFLAILPALKYKDLTAIDPFPPHAIRPSAGMLESQAKAIAFRVAYPDVYRPFGFVAEAVHFDDYSNQLNRDTVTSHLRLGHAFLLLGMRDRAVSHLERALQIDPTDEAAQRALKQAKQ